MPDVWRDREHAADLVVGADIPNVGQAIVAAAGTCVVAEGAGLEGAAASIPEVVLVGQSQGMGFAAETQLRPGLDVQSDVNVGVIHHVIERKAGIGAGGGQDLEKCTVGAVFRIVIPAAVGIPEANPGLEGFHGRLPSRFSNKGIGALGQCSPGTALEGAPNDDIEIASRLGFKDLGIVCAIGSNFDLAMVGGAYSSGAVVGLQDVIAVVDVSDREYAQAARAELGFDGMIECAVVNLDIKFVHAVDLKDALRGARAEEGEIVRS